MVAVFVAQAVSVLLLSVGVGWVILAERRILVSVRAIAYRLSPLPGGGSLQATLAEALDDPGLRLVFPVPESGAQVDPEGRPTALPDSGVIPIEHDGRVVALVARSSDAGPAMLASDLGAAARLAAENEGLVAAVRHEVLELRASRARIVEAADTERRRLERDLHDGAQQRMLSVLYELTLARDAGGRDAARLNGVVADADAAIETLRVIARGIHHSVLTEAGLVAALDALALESPIPLEVDAPADLRCRPDTEATLWRVVEGALRSAVRAGTEGVRVRLARAGEDVTLDLEVDGPVDLDTVALEDRVGARGGRLSVGSKGPAGLSIHAALPCA
jgi:signal transduction histidine kinase